MNIYRFINSRDIRKHLEDMKYAFNALEAAWLVYQCRDATLEEKCQAWTWIIENMPDMEVRERINCSYRKSLHDTLRRYMAMEDDLLKQFLTAGEGVYICEYYENRNKVSSLYGKREVFYDYEDCLSYVKENLEWDHNEDAFVRIKRHFKDRDLKIWVKYDFDCRILTVDFEQSYREEYFDLYSRFFEGLWFDFPTPFKKGDIVYRVGDDLEGPNAFDFTRGIFVLNDLVTWYVRRSGKYDCFADGMSGDMGDMTVYGYYLKEDGTIYNECNFTYMDLEYYRGPFTGIKRIYKALSNYLKGEIDIDLLLYAYRAILSEKETKDRRKLTWFTDEGLRLAGLLEDEE